MNNGVFLVQKESSQAIEKVILAPLKDGQPVVLVVDDSPYMKKKNRYIKHVLLFFTPLNIYGGLKEQVMVAIPSYGSDLIDLREKIKPMTFYRIGLSYRLSRALANALNILTKE